MIGTTPHLGTGMCISLESICERSLFPVRPVSQLRATTAKRRTGGFYVYGIPATGLHIFIISYTGACNADVYSFGSLTTEEKRIWANHCGAQWPCSRSHYISGVYFCLSKCFAFFTWLGCVVQTTLRHCSRGTWAGVCETL